MQQPSVILVSQDVSNNSYGRAHLLAQMLSRSHEVEIIGPASRGVVWEPLADDPSVPCTILSSIECFRHILDSTAEVVYAVKPRVTSFGVPLLTRIANHKPLLLDIDDWEWGYAHFYNGTWRRKLRSVTRITDENNMAYTWLLEKLAATAEQRSVASRFLQELFGGELIPHARDTARFDPSRFDGPQCKAELGLSGRKVVLFLGTPMKHKGLAQLAEAIDRLERRDVTLLVVGATQLQASRLPDKEFIRTIERQPFADMPKFQAAADLVVLFQSDIPAARGQVPAKVFDAMAMAKPIIASDVSDLPAILEDCGEIVRHGDVESLSKKMAGLLDDPSRAAELGRRARQRCIERYSYDAVAPRLHAMVEDLVRGRRCS
jgi:glycosyltransferase involved in cell wall biosynthesis